MGFSLLDEGVQPLLQQEANVDMQPGAPLAPEDEEIVVTSLIHKEQMWEVQKFKAILFYLLKGVTT